MSEIIAIIYDFDGTLAPGNCAEYGLLPALGIDDMGNFWRECREEATSADSDQILTYLGRIAKLTENQGADLLSPLRLREFGAQIPLFPGVEAWFPRINGYAEHRGIELRHYVVSSGLEEMIRGSRIGQWLWHIYGCRYFAAGMATPSRWPAQIVNYTTKTQFLFRINKGVENSWNDPDVNRFIPETQRPVPFRKMIYIGDGDTDIPAMKLVKDQGGHSIAVFAEDAWKRSENRSKIEKLIAEQRANYVAPADYREGSLLDVTIKGLLQLVTGP